MICMQYWHGVWHIRNGFSLISLTTPYYPPLLYLPLPETSAFASPLFNLCSLLTLQYYLYFGDFQV